MPVSDIALTGVAAQEAGLSGALLRSIYRCGEQSSWTCKLKTALP